MDAKTGCAAIAARWRIRLGLIALAMTMQPLSPAWPSAPGPGVEPVAPLSPAAIAAPLADDRPDRLRMAQDPFHRLTIAVSINGQGPFEFLIDTGADRTVISRELAARLGLSKGANVIMHESTGVDDVETVVIDQLQIGSRTVDHIEAPTLAAADLGAAGMLGVDSLKNQSIIMDFKTMQMSSSSSRPDPIGGDTIVVHGRSRFGQLILVNAQVGDTPVYVVIDSGSQVTVGNPALWRLLGDANARRAADDTMQIFGVTGRPMSVQVSNVERVSIEGLVITNVPVGFAQLHTFDRFGLVDKPALLLGMDVLSQCRRVTVDLRRREATFTLN